MRLGKFRIISLIMPMPAIANHIKKYIRIEFLPVTGCDVSAPHYCFRIVAIHMENRRLYCCRKRSTIIRTTGVIKISCKTNLIIDDEMNSSSGVIAFQVAHLDHLVYHTLPCHGGIAMDENWKDLIKITIV